MKNIVKIAAAAAMVMLTACEKEPDPIFPEVQEFQQKAGDTFEFTFEANVAWKLVSDKPTWCVFDTPAGMKPDISGKAGTITVTVNITDEGIGNDPGKPAELSLTMGGQTQVIATIDREPLGYVLKVLNLQGMEIDKVEAGFDDYSTFYVEANFEFAAVSWDDNTFALFGNSISGWRGMRSTGGLMIRHNGMRENTPITVQDNYKIVFSDKSGEHTFEYPVIYRGMNPEAISMTLPEEYPSGWTVSGDGSNFFYRKINRETGNFEYTLAATGSYDFEVVCSGNDFEVVVCVSRMVKITVQEGEEEKEKEVLQREISESWIHPSVDGSRVSLSFDANSSERMRNAEVWVFPAALYERLGGATKILDAIYPGEGASEEAFEESYRIQNRCQALNITQTGKVHADGIVTPIAMRTDLGLSPLTGEQIHERFFDVTRIYDESILTKYGVSAAYTVDYSTSFFLLPQMDLWTLDNFDSSDGSAAASQWDGEYLAQVTMYYKDGTLTAAGNEKEYEVQDISGSGIPGVTGFSAVVYGPKDGWKDPSDPENWVYAVFSVSRKGDNGYEPVSSKLVIIKGPSASGKK